MKKSAIIRIVIYSVIAALLIATLVLGMIFGKGGFFGIHIGSEKYDESQYTVYSNEFSLDSQSIKSLDIEWVSGTVNIKSGNVSAVSVSESADQELEKGDRLRYRVTDKGTLEIKYKESISFFNFFSGNLHKTLTITVPQISEFDEIKFDSSSADMNIDKITSVKQLDADMVSGDMTVRDATIHRTSIDSVSGITNMSGTFAEEIELDSTSGDITINSLVCPQILSVDAVSAKLKLCIPENSGFICDFDGVSGDFASELATSTKDGKYYCGDESADFEIDTVSGDINIVKNNAK